MYVCIFPRPPVHCWAGCLSHAPARAGDPKPTIFGLNWPKEAARCCHPQWHHQGQDPADRKEPSASDHPPAQLAQRPCAHLAADVARPVRDKITASLSADDRSPRSVGPRSPCRSVRPRSPARGPSVGPRSPPRSVGPEPCSRAERAKHVGHRSESDAGLVRLVPRDWSRAFWVTAASLRRGEQEPR